MPLWEKYIHTMQEVTECFYIGGKKSRRMAEEKADAYFILTNGNRVMIKRKLLEKYLDEVASV